MRDIGLDVDGRPAATSTTSASCRCSSTRSSRPGPRPNGRARSASASMPGSSRRSRSAPTSSTTACRPEQQAAAKRLFVSLVTPGEGREDTRARITLPADPRRWRWSRPSPATEARLIVTGDAAGSRSVEVSHEALIRHWEAARLGRREPREPADPRRPGRRPGRVAEAGQGSQPADRAGPAAGGGAPAARSARRRRDRRSRRQSRRLVPRRRASLAASHPRPLRAVCGRDRPGSGRAWGWYQFRQAALRADETTAALIWARLRILTEKTTRRDRRPSLRSGISPKRPAPSATRSSPTSLTAAISSRRSSRDPPRSGVPSGFGRRRRRSSVCSARSSTPSARPSTPTSSRPGPGGPDPRRPSSRPDAGGTCHRDIADEARGRGTRPWSRKLRPGARSTLPLDPAKPESYVAAIVELLKWPTTAGRATDALLEVLHERVPEAPGKEAGLDATVAWVAATYPDIDLDSPPTYPASGSTGGAW